MGHQCCTACMSTVVPQSVQFRTITKIVPNFTETVIEVSEENAKQQRKDKAYAQQSEEEKAEETKKKAQVVKSIKASTKDDVCSRLRDESELNTNLFSWPQKQFNKNTREVRNEVYR